MRLSSFYCFRRLCTTIKYLLSIFITPTLTKRPSRKSLFPPLVPLPVSNSVSATVDLFILEILFLWEQKPDAAFGDELLSLCIAFQEQPVQRVSVVLPSFRAAQYHVVLLCTVVALHDRVQSENCAAEPVEV